jgi:hypothetical protein
MSYSLIKLERVALVVAVKCRPMLASIFVKSVFQVVALLADLPVVEKGEEREEESGPRKRIERSALEKVVLVLAAPVAQRERNRLLKLRIEAAIAVRKDQHLEVVAAPTVVEKRKMWPVPLKNSDKEYEFSF